MHVKVNQRRWIWIGLLFSVIILLFFLILQLDLPNWQKLDLNRIREIPESTMVFDAEGNSLGTLLGARERIYTPLTQIPEHARAAFIAAEDQRFYSHSGIDPRRMLGALLHDMKTMSLSQGASTITQQLIKLTHLSSEKTLARKAQEILLARQLERRMSKDEILEAYLNTVYFGNGAYGIGAAAKAYWGKEASQLSIAQAALLAGVIKSPSNYAPHIMPENALARRDLVLGSMLEQGYISQAEYDSAIAEPLELGLSAAGEGFSGWYADLVLDEALNILGMDTEELLSSGCRIHTAFDPSIQNTADDLFKNGANFPDPAPDGMPVQAALIAMDTENGEIRAVIGGRSYEVQRGLNRATQMLRQPGSAIKPLSSYAAAIEQHGFLPVSMVQDVQREFPGKYLPGNAGGSYYGVVTLREALSRSLNVATVDLADLIGISAVRSALARFGLPLSPRDVNLSLALGAMTDGVSPMQLCAAYCTLANGGTRVEAHAIRRITDRNGRILYETEPAGERAVSDETAFLLTDMLVSAAQSGSAKALGSVGIPVAAKTGTVGEAGGGNRDIWTAAYTPELAVTVWMGFDEPDSDHAMPDYAGGSSYPAQLCAKLLSAVRPSLSSADFTAPESLVPMRIDALALAQEDRVLLAAPNTPPECITVEWFRQNALPTEISMLWDAPEAIEDLTLISGPGEAPALAFTSLSSMADYLILRRTGSDTELVAVVHGKTGETIIWTDPEADLTAEQHYSVLPRHRLLHEHGVTLTGTESAAVTVQPAGLFLRLFG